MTLTLNDLTGGYTAIPVIKNVSFQIKAGQLTGLIGLNGAGKSTTIKHIIGLLTPFSGSVTINNNQLKADPETYRKQFTFVPETPVLYEELTLREHIEVTALAYDMPYEEAMQKAERYIKAFRLEAKMDWFPAYFSKGMKQKVMVVCALITDAKILIIDEPFLGLDPIAIRDFTHLLKERAADGTAILFTTHVLSIADELCDYFLMLRAGVLIGQGNVSQLREQFMMPEASLDDIYIAMTEQEEAL